MKPTQEQVIAWAREAGIDWLIWQEGKCKLKFNDDEVFLFATLAYEAGRKDENEANKDRVETLYKLYEQASQQRDELMQAQTDAIRARREQ